MKTAVWLGVCAMLPACLDIAEQRAERDLEIGRAEALGSSVDVANGLASVRRMEPGYLELWANAPRLALRLQAAEAAPRLWTVVLRNVPPDSAVEVTASPGEAASFTPEATSLGTERRLTLSLPSDGHCELTVGPPDTNDAAAFDFIEFADVQEAVDRVSDVFDKMNQESAARFVVMAGDLTQRGAEDELLRFQQEQQRLTLPIYATLGNHELGQSDVPFHALVGRGSQSFWFHGTRFTFLDSASATLDPLVYDWLEAWSAEASGHLHLAFMHIPPLDPSGIRDGAFSSRAEANKLLARLGRAGVAMTFYGHVHSYYSFENAGIPAFISGGGGAIPERFDGIGRHFLVVHVEPKTGDVGTRVVRVD
jgi:Icc protein